MNEEIEVIITPEDLALSRDEIKAFVNNAQVALAQYVTERRIHYLAEYGWHLGEILREASSVSRYEMAYILASLAYDLLFGEDAKKRIS